MALKDAMRKMNRQMNGTLHQVEEAQNRYQPALRIWQNLPSPLRRELPIRQRQYSS